MDQFTPDSAETRRLLQRMRTGEAAAFDELFARHQDYLRQIVALRLDHRLRPRVDPSDVVQETQLEAIRRLPDFLTRQPMPFRLWLRKTAQERLQMLERRHVTAQRRSVTREVTLPDRSSLELARQFIDLGSSPSRRFKQREVVQLVRQALADLTDTDREILLLRNLECLSNQEAAAVLDVEPATASQRYGRALLRLRQRLIARGVTEGEP
jgi:RNA polymerase sigma-70 factor (ECF subfamily)